MHTKVKCTYKLVYYIFFPYYLQISKKKKKNTKKQKPSGPKMKGVSEENYHKKQPNPQNSRKYHKHHRILERGICCMGLTVQVLIHL